MLARQWREQGVPEQYAHCGTGGVAGDIIPEQPPHVGGAPDWPAAFAIGLANAASAAVDVAGGARTSLTDGRAVRKPWDRALSWFLSSYPLLGGLAARFTIVADADLARSWQISVAAVAADAAEIYINPLAT